MPRTKLIPSMGIRSVNDFFMVRVLARGIRMTRTIHGEQIDSSNSASFEREEMLVNESKTYDVQAIFHLDSPSSCEIFLKQLLESGCVKRSVVKCFDL
jgi:hypothetical protein